MSDEEEERASEEEEEAEAEAAVEEEEDEPVEEEVEAEEAPKKTAPPATEAPKEGLTEAELAMQAAKKKHEEEEANKLKDYEEQRRIQREKEEEELRELKEKQERRRKEREEEEAMMAERKQAEEARRKEEEEERKRKIEADKQRKEAEKAKRQQMMAGQFPGAGGAAGGGPNYQVPQKDKTQEKFDKFGNIVKAKAEMGLTKEQQEEQKRQYLNNHVKPISLEGLDVAAIRAKVKELHQRICKLEADKYDLEKRHERQEYDLKELNERQRQINRNKALKKGLDPDAANSRYPPKLAVASKYDRQTDRRSYTDRRELFESPRKPPPSKIFHGSAKPPTEWGRRENEELELVRKNLEPFKYIEQVKVEGAKPPMEIIPVSYEEGQEEAPADGGGDEEEEE